MSARTRPSLLFLELLAQESDGVVVQRSQQFFHRRATHRRARIAEIEAGERAAQRLAEAVVRRDLAEVLGFPCACRLLGQGLGQLERSASAFATMKTMIVRGAREHAAIQKRGQQRLAAGVADFEHFADGFFF